MGLKKDTLRAGAWNAFGKVGAGLIQFIINIVLARLLMPSDFGSLELLVIFVTLSDALVDSGFGQAIIRDTKATKRDLSSVFYINCAIGVVLYICLFFSAPYIAKFYDNNSLINLSRFVFSVVVFYSLFIVQNAIYSKNLNFKIPAKVSIISMLISGSTAIVMAFCGFGVWALATNMVLYGFLRMCLFWIYSSWRPSLEFSIESIKKYFKFGAFLLLQGMVDKVVTNLESLLIGKVYTTTELGNFSQARKIDSYLVQTSTAVIQRVTYPALARVQDDELKLKDGYRQVLGLTILGMMPLMAFIFAAADNVIHLLLGEKWLIASPYLQLWAIVGFCLSIYSIFTNIFLVKGKSKMYFTISFCRQIVRVLAIVALINISVYALLQGIVGVTIFSTLVYIYFGGRLIKYSLMDVLLDVWQILLAGVIAALCVYVIGDILQAYQYYVVIIVQFFVMIITYLGILSIAKNKHLLELKNLGKSFLKKR